jgi:hypothetical protein
VEILLPLAGGDGRLHPPDKFDALKGRLVEAFGGLTAFTRTPAEGLWQGGGDVDRDQVVIFEVMAPGLDEGWWAQFRVDLEREFRQQEVVIRAHEIRRL